MYEIFAKLLEERDLRAADVCRGTGLPSSLFSEWKRGKSTPKADKLKKIADFFGVTVDYLMTGKNDPNNTMPSELTNKDKRDIGKALDEIMAGIEGGEDGPLYYNGIEVNPESVGFLKKAIEFALTETKKENKVKYNPNKNKK